MREIQIGKREEGQRFDKYLKKYFGNAGSGFIYKMLRKKNITLNGKKASGSDIIRDGDVIKMFLADETIEKFSSEAGGLTVERSSGMTSAVEGSGGSFIMYEDYRISILFEDDDEIFFNKPAGLLSQKAAKEDISLADIFAGYMYSRYGDDNPGYRPGICNRLDRNTSGIVAAGKSVAGLKRLSEKIRERSVRKFYRCIVHGYVGESRHLKGYLVKDREKNKVTVISSDEIGGNLQNYPDAEYIETIYTPIESNDSYSYLEVELITGKSHQIRVHLASIGHPIVGDRKYGLCNIYIGSYHNGLSAERQMLHAYEMRFADKTIIAPLPEDFERVYRYAILEFQRS